METALRLSVIVPVYKAEKHLKNCVDSLLDSSISGYEIILVDDGSPDSCGDICDAYASAHAAVKAVHKTNGGLADARNAGLDAALGEYVVFVDADDVTDPGYIAYVIGQTGRQGETRDLYVLPHFTDHTEAGSSVLHPLDEEPLLTPAEAVIKLEKAGALNFAWNKIYRRAMLEEAPKTRYTINSEPGEDLLFNAACFKKAKTVSFLAKPFYHWIRRGEDTLANRFRDDLYERNMQFIDCRCKLYSALGIDKTALPLLSKGNIAYVFTCIPNMYRKGNRFPRKSRIRFYRDITGSQDVKLWAEHAETDVKLHRQFIKLYKTRSPFIMDSYYLCAMGARNTLGKAWVKARKRLG